jgi:hypothetical protein
MAAKSTAAKQPAGVSSQAVLKATGKNWDAWLAILDAFDVKTQGHPAAARFLKTTHGMSPWWSQMLVVGYEQARGLREKHQKSDGYSVSATKTIATPAAAAFAALREPARRRKWLPGFSWTLRKTTPGKCLRVTCADSTPLEIMIYVMGPQKCQVTFQQDRLSGKQAALRQKQFWREAASRLKEYLES